MEERGDRPANLVPGGPGYGRPAPPWSVPLICRICREAFRERSLWFRPEPGEPRVQDRFGYRADPPPAERTVDDVLTVLIVIGGLFVVIGFTADSISRAMIRRKIADKELSVDQTEALLKRRVDPDSVLKWGLITVSIGLALVVVQFLPPDVRDDPIVIGLILIFAGSALFLYRSIIRRRGGDAHAADPTRKPTRP